MIFQAFIVALIAGICKIDPRVFGMTMLDRPLVVSTLVGLALGDVQTGLTLGAQMELLSLGLMGIGAHSGMPEITVGGALCSAFAITTGTGADMALALTLPISTFASSVGYISWVPLNHLVSERALKAAHAGDDKAVDRCQWLGLFNYFFFPFLLTFVGMLAGAPVFEWLLNVIPTWVTEGVSVASNMLPALGFALLMKLTFTWGMSPYLFVGFVATAFLGMSNVGVAFIGVIIAMIIFMSQKSKSDQKEAELDDNEI